MNALLASLLPAGNKHLHRFCAARIESEVPTTADDIGSYPTVAITVCAEEEQNIPSLCFTAHNCVAGGCAPQVSS